MIPASKKPTTTTPEALPDSKLFWVAGASGVGKTHLMGTLGKGAKLLLIDTEGGAVTFRSRAFADDPDATELGNIDVLDVSRIDDLKQLVYEVDNLFDYLIRSNNSDGYTLVAFDSLTEYLARFLQLHPSPEPRQGYGDVNKAVHGFVTKAKRVPANVAFTSLLTFKDDEVLNREIVRPAVSPGLWQLAGQFHAVGFYELRQQGLKSVRTLDFTHRMRMPGKNRGIFAASYTDPSMRELLLPPPTDAPTPVPAKPAFSKVSRAPSAGGK